MNTVTEQIPMVAIGQSLDGGFFAGNVMIGEQAFALIIAPKADGERAGIRKAEEQLPLMNVMDLYDSMQRLKALKREERLAA